MGGQPSQICRAAADVDAHVSRGYAMAVEAAAHPDRYRNPPDPMTLEAMGDVLAAVAATPDPAGYFRQAMRQWRRTWVENGGPEEQRRLDWG